MGTASVTIRVDESTKRAVSAIAEDFGFDISSITRAFCESIRHEQGVPGPRTPQAQQRVAGIHPRGGGGHREEAPGLCRGGGGIRRHRYAAIARGTRAARVTGRVAQRAAQTYPSSSRNE